MSLEDDFNDAKAFLQTASSGSGLNLYDHLAGVIGNILEERPANAADILESVSMKMKSSWQNVAAASSVADSPAGSQAVATAAVRSKLFEKSEEEEDLDDDEGVPAVADIVGTCKLYEDAGVGVGAEESFRIMLALKKLSAAQPVTDIHFWGKIFGLEKDYIIAQCVYKEGEEPQPEENEIDEAAEAAPEEGEEGDEKPKSTYIKPKPLAMEEYGTGVNKYAYFVCNAPGEEWTALPNATPAAIVRSRAITKFFTGNLGHKVSSHPPFLVAEKTPTEAHLLRAVIARISAETHLSPLGMFTFDDDEEEDEDGGRSNYIADEEYEGVTKSALLDPTMAGWAHHVQFILPQGRTKWMNPKPPKEDEDEEDEDEEAEEEEVEPETGPPLLTPAQEDEPVDDGPAWSTKLTSQLNAKFAAVVASSNKWPGAHALAYEKGKKFENVYIGHGVAYSPEPFNPNLPPMPQAEYAINDGITETVDPTPEEEEAFKAEQAKEDDDGDAEEDED
mmetsp:Transcript_19784/g.51504  ORF Transcript_19784/g.51504 Transcript_19784/m.51504 type:complete len:504 (+) Transcript_19784:55-1566(+)|eukprot:CAMPEP_0182924740 /NCGR_PEP_ID=MMETSP0105_2-20130417/7182_1 /TAXON_ID=81532 ORGANISM="Acanthoeca-like sp., Strain 10tr" /NCGR_SAMPLE_ID=MMETSP0105_2 /ASSEMBLY_ACC=CAM_ASM_000205 /LENGTH=503 /DNA_ID=CAMNT_0025062541 /DNA_START=56 /DNA_END=1567 /DNA_ORIENTATION=+